MGEIDVLAPLIGGVLNMLAAGIGLATVLVKRQALVKRRPADRNQPESGSET
ncbi:hypothetical protein ACFQ07_23870 [Actinomadura adrarensis]|uniref:Uncharacterized protein n=1 Tax=Actinomadura adrarensis TaxID=1819600 RepID=A0ABW3CL95_9ACTN